MGRLPLMLASVAAIASCDWSHSASEPGVDGGGVPVDGSDADLVTTADAAVPPGDAGDGGGAPLEIATWNVENFPLGDETTELVAETVRSLDLDLVAIQEVADEDAFELLAADLDGYDYVLSDHTYADGSYQKLAFLYRSRVLRVTGVELLFTGELTTCEEEGTDRDPFPRPPLQVDFEVGDRLADKSSLTAINLHLKAFQPDHPLCNDCRERRACANRHLEAHVRERVDGVETTPRVLLLGDFNERLDRGGPDDPFSHWDSPLYRVHTSHLTTDDYSFVELESLIDHAIITDALAEAFPGDGIEVVYLDETIDDYTDRVSDHLPVTMSFAPWR